MDDQPAFREVQRLSQVLWIMLIIYGGAALMWYAFVQQIILGYPWGTNPGPDWLIWLLWLGIGIGLPVLFHKMDLIVEVWDDHLRIEYIPFVNFTIPFTDIKSFEARTYSPIKEYGGWGIRGWGQKRAYNVRGNEGVELKLNNGRQIMIGSQKAQELALILKNKGAR